MLNRSQFNSQAVTRFTGITAARTLMQGRGTLIRVIVINAGGSSPNIVFTTTNDSPLNPPFFEIPAASVTTGGIIPIYRPYSNGLNLASLPSGSVIEIEVKGG